MQTPHHELLSDDARALLAKYPEAELTFIDADDRYRFYTQGNPPIFTRTEEILGSDVMICHPEDAQDAVRELLNEMRAGRIDDQSHEHRIHGHTIEIRYIAIRKDGEYRGCLELVRRSDQSVG